MESPLILPGSIEFDLALGVLPPNWQQERSSTSEPFALVVRADGPGFLEPLSGEALEEYLEGGEWDEVLDQQGDENDGSDFA